MRQNQLWHYLWEIAYGNSNINLQNLLCNFTFSSVCAIFWIGVTVESNYDFYVVFRLCLRVRIQFWLTLTQLLTNHV